MNVYLDANLSAIDDEGSDLQPIVGSISCNEQINEYFNGNISHFWKFTLSDAADVTFSNCNSSVVDTKLFVRDVTGQLISTNVCADGDCDKCPGSTKEILTLSLETGTHFVETTVYHSNPEYAGVYLLDLECPSIASPTPEPTTPQFSYEIGYNFTSLCMKICKCIYSNHLVRRYNH